MATPHFRDRIRQATDYLSLRQCREISASEFIRDVIDRYLDVMIPQWKQEDAAFITMFPELKAKDEEEDGDPNSAD